MSEREKPTFEILSAFVDNELDAVDRGWVLWWIDHDQDVARDVCALQDLKGRIASLQRTLPAQPVLSRGGFGRNAALALIAASLTCALIVSAVYRTDFAQTFLGRQPVSAQIVAAYDNWSSSHALPVNTSSRDIELFRHAGLLFQGEETLIVADHTITHSIYRGSGGCRVSVFEFPPGAIDPQSVAGRIRSAEYALSTAWMSRRGAHVMVARRMDRKRFDAIAAALQDLDREEPDLIVAEVEIPHSACTG